MADYLKNEGLLHVLSIKYGRQVGHREIVDRGDYINTIIECRFTDLFNENFLYEQFRPDNFYDVVICEGPWAGYLGMKLKDKGRAGLYVYEDIDYFPAFFQYDFVYETVRGMEDRCMAKADLIFTVSKTLKQFRDGYLDSSKIFISPNGIDKIYASQGVREDNIIYAGTLDEWSGIDMVIKAYAKVTESEGNSKFLIYGGGKMVNEYRNLINRLNIADRAFIMGMIPHRTLIDIYNRSLIGVCVLKPIEVVRYCFPIKLIEYMASGLPSVVTGYGDMDEIINESGCGISVDYEEDEIADALLHLIGMGMEEREKMADRGREYAKDFQWKDIFKDELDIIKARLSE